MLPLAAGILHFHFLVFDVVQLDVFPTPFNHGKLTMIICLLVIWQFFISPKMIFVWASN